MENSASTQPGDTDPALQSRLEAQMAVNDQIVLALRAGVASLHEAADLLDDERDNDSAACEQDQHSLCGAIGSHLESLLDHAVSATINALRSLDERAAGLTTAANATMDGHQDLMTETTPAAAQPQPRSDYMNMVDVARLLSRSHSRIGQWVHDKGTLPEAFPAPDQTYQRSNGGLVPWWRTTRRRELVAWHNRYQAWIAANFINRPQPRRGAPRTRNAADVARLFLSENPLAALMALATVADTPHPGDLLSDEQSSLAEQALELAALMADYIPEDDAPNDQLHTVLRTITTPRHARVVSDGGAANQLAFLLDRLGYRALTDCLEETGERAQRGPDEGEISAARMPLTSPASSQ